MLADSSAYTYAESEKKAYFIKFICSSCSMFEIEAVMRQHDAVQMPERCLASQYQNTHMQMNK